ncbi:5'-nucleotidase C-terminal domain-containing protein [Shouchella shacheensis]|uniref:5'-nucleotidase C-terminal domain-containing protein n=1 Tax=Shouchella shacheensis TaxID=1649580 RepID=UPI000B2A6D6C|nr:5'-nucleotidase C-terminal domain-containing protein [Shouchella shacheensis]
MNKPKETSLHLTAFLSMILILFTTGFAQEAHAETDETTLNILHTNDIHAAFDDFGKVSAYITEVRETSEHFLYMDAGDFASGNPVVDLNYGKPMIDVFNLAGIDAFTIGNHEFDYGQDYLQENMESSEFPWLGANMSTGSSEVTEPDPYVILDANGLSVGVLGITQAPPATAPGNTVGMEFDADYVSTALEYQDELEEQADVIVALTHIGHGPDQRLAEEVEYFDVIIGGHSHTTLSEPAVVNGTPIVQAGSSLDNVGELELTYNAGTDEVTSVSGGLQPVSALEDVDEDVQAVIDGYNEEMDELLGEVIGYSTTGLSRDGRYNGDAPLGNFWTDAMRDFGEADVAFTNNGGIRDSIPAGDVTLNEIYQIEPFANEIMLIEMTGEAIADVLDYSYSRNNRNQIDLQVSGMEYEIVTGMTGSLQEVKLTQDGEALDPDGLYTVAVADYIGTGGSGYNFEGTVVSETIGLMTEAMTQYAQKLTEEGKDLDYTSENRIQVTVDPSGPLPGETIGSTETGLYSANKHAHDVGLGNLYTDSIRAKTESDIAILNGSSITGQIPPGPITDEQIESLDSFGNTIVQVETTGERLRDVILEQANYHNGVDVQASGITYTLIPHEGSGGFSEAEILLENGEPLDPETSYTVSYNDYMHGNSFYHLGDATGDELGPVWQSVVDYVQTQEEPINYSNGSRITIDGQEVDPDPTGRISVAEAIANNSGSATVSGYIVGSINNNQPVLGEGSHAPSNLLLADSPEETDRENMLPIQLVNNTPVRNGLNLVQHPENLGEHVAITGSLETYFSTPGIRSPTAYEFIDDSEEPDEACVHGAWSSSEVYVGGDRVKHEGQTFEAKWWTQGENPNDSSRWDVWKLAEDCLDEEEGDSYPTWSSSDIYVAGDRVEHEGHSFEAKWWTQGDDPNDSGQWDVWKQIEE